MVAIIFFPSGHPHLANHPPPPVRICPVFPRNVRRSCMDGPQLKTVSTTDILIDQVLKFQNSYLKEHL